MAKDSYFVKLENPKEVRRNLLENTRAVLRILKSHEEFKAIKHKKTDLIQSFKIKINEINLLVADLKKILPKVKLNEVREIKMPAALAELTEHPVRELKKLEQELAEVESKLNQLS